MHVLITTVHIENSQYAMLPVRIGKPLPKRLIFRAMGEISKIKVQAPIKVYDVIAKNILGTGVNLIATWSMDRTN